MTIIELCRKYGFKPQGILHVGAGSLEEAPLYHHHGIEAVVWVEARPPKDGRLYERALSFRHILFEGIPLSDRKEKVKLHISSNLVSSSLMPFQRHKELYPDITVTEEVELLAQTGDVLMGDRFPEIDTLVLDVQGSELKVLRGMVRFLQQIKWALIEVADNPLYQGQPLRPAVESWMHNVGGFSQAEYFPIHAGEWGEEFFSR